MSLININFTIVETLKGFYNGKQIHFPRLCGLIIKQTVSSPRNNEWENEHLQHPHEQFPRKLEIFHLLQKSRKPEMTTISRNFQVLGKITILVYYCHLSTFYIHLSCAGLHESIIIIIITTNTQTCPIVWHF